MEEIARVVANYYEITYEELFTGSRKRMYVKPRQMCFVIMRERGYVLQRIGKFFKKDHVSVMHGIKTVNEEIKLYPEERKIYESIIKSLNPKFIPKPKFFGGFRQEICNPCIYVRS